MRRTGGTFSVIGGAPSAASRMVASGTSPIRTSMMRATAFGFARESISAWREQHVVSNLQHSGPTFFLSFAGLSLDAAGAGGTSQPAGGAINSSALAYRAVMAIAAM